MRYSCSLWGCPFALPLSIFPYSLNSEMVKHHFVSEFCCISGTFNFLGFLYFYLLYHRLFDHRLSSSLIIINDFHNSHKAPMTPKSPERNESSSSLDTLSLRTLLQYDTTNHHHETPGDDHGRTNDSYPSCKQSKVFVV